MKILLEFGKESPFALVVSSHMNLQHNELCTAQLHLKHDTVTGTHTQ